MAHSEKYMPCAIFILASARFTVAYARSLLCSFNFCRFCFQGCLGSGHGIDPVPSPDVPLKGYIGDIEAFSPLVKQSPFKHSRHLETEVSMCIYY